MDHVSAIFLTALLLSLVALASIVVSIVASGHQLRMQSRAAMDLEHARFDFEKRLAYVRGRVAKAAEDWRRRAEFAERALTDFYQAELMLHAARARPLYAGAPTFSDYKAARSFLDSRQDFYNEFRRRRLTARALFGETLSSVFDAMIELIEEVRYASGRLAEAAYVDRELELHERASLEAIIWVTDEATDEVSERLAAVIRQAEDLLWPSLGAPVAESEP